MQSRSKGLSPTSAILFTLTCAILAIILAQTQTVRLWQQQGSYQQDTFPNNTMSLPTLPRSIFNANLYRRVLRLWFEGHPPNVTGPTEVTMKKWFAAGVTPEAKKAFDTQCFDIAKPALDFLSPEKYTLPAWKSHEEDRKQADFLTAPFRKIIVEDGARSRTNTSEDALTRGDVARSLVLLLDQFPRNIYRDPQEQWRVYSHYDRLARALSYGVLGAVPNKAPFADISRLDIADGFENNPARRIWFYMPLEHSESLADHDLVEGMMQEMKTTCESQQDETGAGFVSSYMNFEKQHRDILEKFGRYCHRNEMVGRESTKEEAEFLAGGGQTFGTK